MDQKQLLLYADDIIFMTKTPEKADIFIQKLEYYCSRNYLKINYEKSKILEKNLNYSHNRIKNGEQIKYLGLLYDHNGLLVEDNCNLLLKEIFKQSNIIKTKAEKNKLSISEKIEEYKTFLLPHINNSDVLYYIKKEPVQKLHKIARDCLKQILGANYSIKTEELNLICNLHDPKVRATKTIKSLQKKMNLGSFIRRKKEYDENSKRLQISFREEQKKTFGCIINKKNVENVFQRINKLAAEKFKAILDTSSIENQDKIHNNKDKL